MRAAAFLDPSAAQAVLVPPGLRRLEGGVFG